MAIKRHACAQIPFYLYPVDEVLMPEDKLRTFIVTVSAASEIAKPGAGLGKADRSAF